MLSVLLTEKGGTTRRLDFEKDEITIGRTDENDICLPKGNISKKHARIVLKDAKMIVVDLKSTNGTAVNGKRLAAPQVVTSADRIFVGDFIINVSADEADPALSGEEPILSPSGAVLGGGPSRVPAAPAPQIEEEEQEDAEPPPPAYTPPAPAPAYLDSEAETPAPGSIGAPEPIPLTRPRPPPAAPPPEPIPLMAARPAPVAPMAPRPPARAPAAPAAGRLEAYGELLSQVHDKLIEALDLRRLDLDRLGDDGLRQRAEAALRQIISRMDTTGELPMSVDREELISDVLNEALGLGPLEKYLADDSISEIMVNHAHQIYVERQGKLVRAEKLFSSNKAVLGVIERIVAPLGRRIDESSPLVDARLKDGSRVNAIIPPLALKGPTITIRKFKRDLLGVQDMIELGTLTEPMSNFLDTCVKVRKNVLISGGTGSGKTTLLNILSAFIPETERIVTIEDAAELQLPQDHWVQLEARPANIEGKGAIQIRDLVRNALRMRPDRIVVGECRGGEALDMLQAMNTGHDGSLTTLHSNSPRDALSRLETMVLMAGMDLPVRAIRDQVASAINIIIQQARFADGSRKITAITEVSGMEGEVITLQDIFYYKQEGFDSEGHVLGRFVATGFVPRFYDDLQRRGIPVNMDIFREE
jgi:pilus assembly protein CpaF